MNRALKGRNPTYSDIKLVTGLDLAVLIGYQVFLTLLIDNCISRFADRFQELSSLHNHT
jgi:hypothetical protein